MPYKHFPLPKYPVTSDMWDELKNENRPIMVYGMGNGADKLFEHFSKYGIIVKEIFASDGFVRGHSFRGYKVKSFSEIRAEYKDFVIVLSFASNREDVISMLSEIDENYDMYAPDMPVAGVDEYFDKDFYNLNYEKILKAYNSLDDDDSKAIFSSVVNYKLTGRIKYLLSAFSSRDEVYALMPIEDIEIAVDAGAYNGDTVREMKQYMPRLYKVYALEPDKKNFKKLIKYSGAESSIDVVSINSAAWKCDGNGAFLGSGNRNSTAVATASHEHQIDEISFVKIDGLTNEKIDYIKYDVEGAEREALEGSQRLINDNYPCLLISLYHRSRDIFELINYVREEYAKYTLYLRRLKCLPAWEIDLICVKK